MFAEKEKLQEELADLGKQNQENRMNYLALAMEEPKLRMRLKEDQEIIKSLKHQVVGDQDAFFKSKEELLKA